MVLENGHDQECVDAPQKGKLGAMTTWISTSCRSALYRLGFGSKPWNEEKQRKWDEAIAAGRMLEMEDAPPGYVEAFVKACFEEAEKAKTRIYLEDLRRQFKE